MPILAKRLQQLTGSQGLLVASSNAHKVSELKALFASVSVHLTTAEEAGFPLPQVAETGRSIQENARLKGAAVATATGRITLADDTALCVDALGGAPGVHTARYAGPGATREKNCQKLIQELKRVIPERRTSRFVCCLCIAFPDSTEPLIATGECRGRIQTDPEGQFGFGYDAYFWVEETGSTMAQLNDHQRLTVTHRAHAFESLLGQSLSALDA